MLLKLQKAPRRANHGLLYGLIMKCNHRRCPAVHVLCCGRFRRHRKDKKTKKNKTEQQGIKKKKRAGGRELLRPASPPDGQAAAQKGRARLMTQRQRVKTDTGQPVCAMPSSLTDGGRNSGVSNTRQASEKMSQIT